MIKKIYFLNLKIALIFQINCFFYLVLKYKSMREEIFFLMHDPRLSALMDEERRTEINKKSGNGRGG